MKRIKVALLTAALLALSVQIGTARAEVPADGTAFDGAFVFTQLAFTNSHDALGKDVLAIYHVFLPPSLWNNFDRAQVYRFPDCPDLRPVFDEHVVFDDSPPGTTDRPNRRIIDVRLKSGCAVQPKSEGEVKSLAAKIVKTGNHVNAPSVPSPNRATDDQLFPPPPDAPGSPFTNAGWNANVASNADPFTGEPLFQVAPRVPAFPRKRNLGFSEGREMYYVTYEATGMPEYEGTKFPNVYDIFFMRYSPGLDETSVANLVEGAPIVPGKAARMGYSPFWVFQCVGGIGAVGPSCLGPTFQQVGQPTYLDEALFRLEAAGLQADLSEGDPTGVLCPIFAVDLNNDGDFLDSGEVANLGDDAIFFPPSRLVGN